MADHFEWQDHYSVGVEEIDSDHKKLAGILNRVVHAVSNHHGKEAVSAIFEELTRHTIRHFEHEEWLMKGALYPGLEDHRAAHEFLVDKLKVFHDDFQNERIDMMSVANFLVDWLLVHVLGEDARLGLFLREQGIDWEER